MSVFSFLVYYVNTYHVNLNIFAFVQPMAVGFIAFAAFRMYKISIKSTITYVIMMVGLFATYFLFKTPWGFASLIILGGVVTNFSDKRIPEKENIRPKQIKWTNIWVSLLLICFL